MIFIQNLRQLALQLINANVQAWILFEKSKYLPPFERFLYFTDILYYIM